jgi:hypothetical protein
MTTIARGLVHGGGTMSTLLTAWCCLLAFSAMGYVVGRVAESIVEDSVRSRITAELAAEEAAASPQ